MTDKNMPQVDVASNQTTNRGNAPIDVATGSETTTRGTTQVATLNPSTDDAQVQVEPTPKKSLSSSPKKDKQRLNLDLSPAAFALLTELSDKTGKNMADVLRTGLALYGLAYEAKDRGQGIGIVDEDRVVKEILIT
jgi:hypothetical protein